MKGKELIRDMISTYFMLVTMISVVMALLGMTFFPNAKFGYEAFKTPLFFAALGTLPNIIMYSQKELTIKQLLIRKIIQLILVEIIAISIAIPAELNTLNKDKVILSLAISIFIIYILTHIIEWFQNRAVAKQMTEELLNFQQNHQ